MLGAVHSVNPLELDSSIDRDILTQQDGVATKVLDGVLGALVIMDNVGDRIKMKREKAAAKKPKAD